MEPGETSADVMCFACSIGVRGAVQGDLASLLGGIEIKGAVLSFLPALIPVVGSLAFNLLFILALSSAVVSGLGSIRPGSRAADAVSPAVPPTAG